MPKKTNKRGNGEGTIFQRSDDRWCASIQIATDNDGKPIRKNFYGKQRKDVVEKLDNYKFKIQSGETVSISITLDEYILNWLTVVKSNELKPSSYDRLESTIKNYIIPNLGYYKIDELTSLLIQSDLINKMTAEKLSYSSIKKAYDALNACLKYSVNNHRLKYNPMQTVVKPSTSKFVSKTISILTDDEVGKFVKECNATYSNDVIKYKTANAFILILYTGIRLGEALSLKWSDIDFYKNTVKIDGNLILTKNRNKKIESEPNNILIVFVKRKISQSI